MQREDRRFQGQTYYNKGEGDAARWSEGEEEGLDWASFLPPGARCHCAVDERGDRTELCVNCVG